MKLYMSLPGRASPIAVIGYTEPIPAKRKPPSRIRKMPRRRYKAAMKKWLKTTLIAEINKLPLSDGKLLLDDVLDCSLGFLNSVLSTPGSYDIEVSRELPATP